MNEYSWYPSLAYMEGTGAVLTVYLALSVFLSVIGYCSIGRLYDIITKFRGIWPPTTLHFTTNSSLIVD